MRLDHLLSMEYWLKLIYYSILRVYRTFKVRFLTAYGWIPERPKGADCKSVAIASKVRILLRPVKMRTSECLSFFVIEKTNGILIVDK